jgi:hypothetical protein
VLDQNVPRRLMAVLLGNEGIYPSVLDSNYFQKNCLCNADELLFRSRSYMQMQHDLPANPPNRHNTYLLVCVDVLDWWMTIRRNEEDDFEVELDAVDVVSFALAVISLGINALVSDSILAATAPITVRN